MNVLDIDQLTMRFPGFQLGPINLQLEQGVVLGCVGENGAGKTSLFRSLMGISKRDSGEVRVLNHLASNTNAYWKSCIGYVGDVHVFFENWSGAENLKAFARFYPNWSHDLAGKISSRLRLPLDKPVKQYSTGQRTKLAITLALAHQPKLLLLDEPTTGLDASMRDEFMSILFDIIESGEVSVIYATHYLMEIEQLADEILFLDNGKQYDRVVKDELNEQWRKISFRGQCDLNLVPGVVSSIKQNLDYQVVSRNYQQTVDFLKDKGMESIVVSRMSMEAIGVQIMRNLMVQN